MCGIVGYVGNKQVVPLIIDGLRKLEYRGYDSAGIAVVDDAHHLELRRAEGKLRNLEECIRLNPLDGNYGIGHTRWATHGRPTEENAHPHRDCTGRIVVVHNGIIENYLSLKEMLREKGHEFKTETDTEIVAHLIEEHEKEGLSFEESVRKSVQQLKGIFALSMISSDEPDKIIAVREGPPVVIGLGDGEFFVASGKFVVDAQAQSGLLADDGVDGDGVGVARGFVIAEADLDHGQKKTLRLEFAVRDAFGGEKRGAGDFKPRDVAAVVNDAHHVGLGVTDLDLAAIFEHGGKSGNSE